MEQAKEGELAQNATIASVANGSTTGTTAAVAPATGRDLVSVPRAFNPAQPGMAGDAVLARLNEGSTDSANPQVVYRAAGDKCVRRLATPRTVVGARPVPVSPHTPRLP